MERRTFEIPDLSEKGAPREGQPQVSNRRLFVQFTAFGDCRDSQAARQALERGGVEGALYEDLNDPRGIAVLTISEDPAFFAEKLRSIFNQPPFAELVYKPEYSMLGRSYSLGYEPDLEDTLLGRPRRTALNPDWPWAIWYPLRRSGQFVHLAPEEQRSILMEHGSIGMAFGAADFAHDIRLACHGLDRNDNDFVIGLVGKELFPLSAIVQTMRKTRQTSQYLDRLGPFFVGRALWQSAGR